MLYIVVPAASNQVGRRLVAGTEGQRADTVVRRRGDLDVLHRVMILLRRRATKHGRASVSKTGRTTKQCHCARVA